MGAIMAPGRVPQQGQGRQIPPPRRGGGPGKRPPMSGPAVDPRNVNKFTTKEAAVADENARNLAAEKDAKMRKAAYNKKYGKGKSKGRGRMASKDFVKNQMEKEIAAGNATEEDLAMEMQKYDDRMDIVGVHPNQQQAPQVQDQLTPGQIRRNKEREMLHNFRPAPEIAGMPAPGAEGRAQFAADPTEGGTYGAIDPRRPRGGRPPKGRKQVKNIDREKFRTELGDPNDTQRINELKENYRRQMTSQGVRPQQAGGRPPKGQSGRRPMPPRTGGGTPGPMAGGRPPKRPAPPGMAYMRR